MRMLYMISIIILWVCIAVNIFNLIRVIRMQKEHQIAIDASYEAWKKFLVAAENYNSMAEELCAEKEDLRTPQESEEDTNEQL